MSNSLVTVVVPIYNVEQYLDRCIESIVNQTYTNLEIILVDDGSPDNCPAICDAWVNRDKRIKVVHKSNAGLGMARNTGIENANGDYVFFFDSDDYVDKTIVEKCLQSAQKNGSDAVIYGRNEIFGDGRRISKYIKSSKNVFDKTEITNELLPAMYSYKMGFGVSAWGKMFSLDVIRRSSLRFVSEREVISEDAYFALEFFSRANKVSIVNECLYFYCTRENSLSQTFRNDRQEQNDKFLRKCLSYADTADMPNAVIIHLTARYQMYVFASMKQLLASKLPQKEKRLLLNNMFRSDVMRASLSTEVLCVHKQSLRVFFTLLKFKCYLLCKALLYIKIANS